MRPLSFHLGALALRTLTQIEGVARNIFNEGNEGKVRDELTTRPYVDHQPMDSKSFDLPVRDAGRTASPIMDWNTVNNSRVLAAWKQ